MGELATTDDSVAARSLANCKSLLMRGGGGTRHNADIKIKVLAQPTFYVFEVKSLGF